MIKFIHRWFAWILVVPITGLSFTVTSYWTLNHNPLTTDNGLAVAGTPGLPTQLARSRARLAKLQIILGATQQELQQINADIVSYKGKAVATTKWAATQPTTPLPPGTSATTGPSGVVKK